MVRYIIRISSSPCTPISIDWKIDEQNIIQVAKRPELDRWIISRLHSLVKDVSAFYEDYEPTKAARAVERFVDEDLSNWYVRLNRRRFWKGELNEDKKAAYETLYECLNVVAQLMSSNIAVLQRMDV
ncbi:MAG: class I tRNA ligase family protein [Chitinophagaceae bacterium]